MCPDKKETKVVRKPLHERGNVKGEKPSKPNPFIRPSTDSDDTQKTNTGNVQDSTKSKSGTL